MGEDKITKHSQYLIFKVLITQLEASPIPLEILEIDKKYKPIMINHQIYMIM
jgi:hypothetical protein